MTPITLNPDLGNNALFIWIGHEKVYNAAKEIRLAPQKITFAVLFA